MTYLTQEACEYISNVCVLSALSLRLRFHWSVSLIFSRFSGSTTVCITHRDNKIIHHPPIRDCVVQYLHNSCFPATDCSLCASCLATMLLILNLPAPSHCGIPVFTQDVQCWYGFTYVARPVTLGKTGLVNCIHKL